MVVEDTSANAPRPLRLRYRTTRSILLDVLTDESHVDVARATTTLVLQLFANDGSLLGTITKQRPSAFENAVVAAYAEQAIEETNTPGALARFKLVLPLLGRESPIGYAVLVANQRMPSMRLGQAEVEALVSQDGDLSLTALGSSVEVTLGSFDPQPYVAEASTRGRTEIIAALVAGKLVAHAPITKQRDWAIFAIRRVRPLAPAKQLRDYVEVRRSYNIACTFLSQKEIIPELNDPTYPHGAPMFLSDLLKDVLSLQETPQPSLSGEHLHERVSEPTEAPAKAPAKAPCSQVHQTNNQNVTPNGSSAQEKPSVVSPPTELETTSLPKEHVIASPSEESEVASPPNEHESASSPKKKGVASPPKEQGSVSPPQKSSQYPSEHSRTPLLPEDAESGTTRVRKTTLEYMQDLDARAAQEEKQRGAALRDMLTTVQLLKNNTQELNDMAERVYATPWTTAGASKEGDVIPRHPARCIDPAVARRSDLKALKRELRQEFLETLSSYVLKQDIGTLSATNSGTSRSLAALERDVRKLQRQQAELQTLVSNLCAAASTQAPSATVDTREADPNVRDALEIPDLTLNNVKDPLLRSFLQFMRGLEISSQLTGESFRQLQAQLHYPEAFRELALGTGYPAARKATALVQDIETIMGALRAGGTGVQNDAFRDYTTDIRDFSRKPWWPLRPFTYT